MYIGTINFRNDHRRFRILEDDRRRHIYCIGKTGVGKSTLLESMAIQDIQEGRGVCFLDPHGQSAEKLLDFVPASRINDVVYFNPADTDYPIAFNPMESCPEEKRFLVVSNMIKIFHKIWSDSWGPQLEDILRNTLMAIMETKPSTLLGVQRMLEDDAYRIQISKKISDPIVKRFWLVRFPEKILKRRDDPLASTLNKVGQFLTVFIMRNILGQAKSSFNIREVMDQQKILICNLSKGKIGEDNSSLLGAMLITQIYLSGMSRADLKEEDRKDFYVYVDEFQNFANESFANILSEARKYHLCLTLANQYIDQLTEEIRNAIIGNCGTIISFRVGSTDAPLLEKEMQIFTEQDFVSLDKYQFYIRMSIEGITSQAFSAMTLPPSDEAEGNADKIIKTSRERYAKKRREVEDKILRWSSN